MGVAVASPHRAPPGLRMLRFPTAPRPIQTRLPSCRMQGPDHLAVRRLLGSLHFHGRMTRGACYDDCIGLFKLAFPDVLCIKGGRLATRG